jgi:hypothetical protein
VLGEEHPAVAETLNNIGMSYVPCITIIDTIILTIYTNNAYLFDTLNNTGLLLYTQGSLKEALPLYERALQVGFLL